MTVSYIIIGGSTAANVIVVVDADNKIEDLQDELDDAAALAERDAREAGLDTDAGEEDILSDTESTKPGFMSESIYGKLPAEKSTSMKRPKARRKLLSVKN
jgi:hypothetical protein